MQSDILRSLHSIRQAELVIEQEARQDHLDGVGGEESAGTGVLSMAEMQVVPAGRGELVAVALARQLTLRVVSQAVEHLRIRCDGRVHGDGVDGHHEVHA